MAGGAPLITVVGPDNNYGLSREKKLLSDFLTKAGIPFRCSRPNSGDPVRTRAVLFLEVVDGAWLRKGGLHYVFPDAEWWMPKWDDVLKRDDFFVLAKTRDAEKLFHDLGGNVRYTGFTATDRHDRTIEKKREFLHVAGRSLAKGTAPIVRLWNRRPDLPKLTVTLNPKIQEWKNYRPAPNLEILAETVEDGRLRQLQNERLFHLCPSEYEGFGHSIWEGKSCGSVMITTGAGPMSEAVRPEFGVLAEPAWKGKMRHATTHVVNDVTLEKAVEAALSMNNAELYRRSRLARASFLENDKRWKELVVGIFRAIR